MKSRSTTVLSLFAFVCFLISSCATKVPFLTSSVVPAAKGRVKITKDNNKNNAIELDVENLVKPETLDPSKNAYVLWMQTESNGIKNMGQIQASRSLFSSTLTASMNTVTYFKPTKFFITSESDAGVQYPGQTIVLSTDQFKYKK